MMVALQLQGQVSRHFNAANGLALDGYDVVAYFTDGKAKKGEKSNCSQYEGLKWCFASDQNRETFLADPQQYLPMYGGWCAYAMGDSGKKVGVDPGTFKIINGRLYLFYNAFFNNTLKSWNKDEKNLKIRADRHWSETLKSK